MMRMSEIVIVALAVLVSAFAQSGISEPNKAGSASQTTTASVPPLSHDQHEGMDVSVDPYITPERAKEKFGKASPIPAGILPVEVFLRNETSQPIRINLSTIQLEVRINDDGRQDIDWLMAEEVADAIVHPGGPPAPQTRRLPLGIPLPSKDKKTEKLAETLRPFLLDADVVPPMATIHGFLFFNMSHKMSLAEKSSLYVPDAAFIPSDKPLMFFEVPLSGASRP
jgi:hypothetical protein